jgi:hypothetical protein
MAVRPIALFALIAALPAGAAYAQVSPAEGNWACRALIDGTKSGILTIFAGSYGYASANYKSAASGTGDVQLATDGATFLDGNLVVGAGITTALASVNEQGQDILTLYQPPPDGSALKPILVCTVR